MASSFPLVIASALFALLSFIAIIVSITTSSWYLVQTDTTTTHFGTYQICTEIRNESDSKVCHRTDSQDFVAVGDPLAPECRRSASDLSTRFGSLFGILIVAAIICLVSIGFLVVITVKGAISLRKMHREDDELAATRRQDRLERTQKNDDNDEHDDNGEQTTSPPQPTSSTNPIITQQPKENTKTATSTMETTVDVPTTTTTNVTDATAPAADASSSTSIEGSEDDYDDYELVEYNEMPLLEIIPLVTMSVVVIITIIAWAAYISNVTSWLYCDNSPCAFLGKNDEVTVCEASMGYGFAFAVFAWLSAIFSVFLLALRWVMLKVFGVDKPEEESCDEEEEMGEGEDGAESPHDIHSPPDTLNNTQNGHNHTTTTQSLNNTLNRTNNGEVSMFVAENNHEDDHGEDEQCGRVIMPNDNDNGNDITSQGSRGSGNPKKKKKGSFNNRGHFDPMLPHQVPEEDNCPDNHSNSPAPGSRRQGTKTKYPTHRIWKY